MSDDANEMQIELDVRIPELQLRYVLHAVNDKTGVRECISDPFQPMTHHEACTMKSKLNPHKDVRILLVECNS